MYLSTFFSLYFTPNGNYFMFSTFINLIQFKINYNVIIES